MKLYCENKQYKLYNGNMLDMLEVIPYDNSTTTIVEDIDEKTGEVIKEEYQKYSFDDLWDN